MAALKSSSASAGSTIVIQGPGETFVDGLRARSVIATLGASVIESPLPMAEPRLDGDVVVEWLGEDPGSDLSDTEPTLGSVAYSLHTLACTVPYSRQLFAEAYGIRSVDAVIARAAQAAMGAELDRVGIRGSGSGDEPAGVLNTAGIGVVPIATDGGTPYYEHLVDLEADVAAADAEAVKMGFATTPGVRKHFRKTEMFSSSNGGPVWAGSRLLGHPAAVTTNVPSDLTKGTGTGLHGIVYGNWADLVVAMLPAMDVVVDPFTLKNQGLVEVTYFLYLDVQVRHAASFAAVIDAIVP